MLHFLICFVFQNSSHDSKDCLPFCLMEERLKGTLYRSKLICQIMKNVAYQNNMTFSIRNMFIAKIKCYIKTNIFISTKYWIFLEKKLGSFLFSEYNISQFITSRPIMLRTNMKYRSKTILQFINKKHISHLNTSQKH